MHKLMRVYAVCSISHIDEIILNNELEVRLCAVVNSVGFTVACFPLCNVTFVPFCTNVSHSGTMLPSAGVFANNLL